MNQFCKTILLVTVLTTLNFGVSFAQAQTETSQGESSGYNQSQPDRHVQIHAEFYEENSAADSPSAYGQIKRLVLSTPSIATLDKEEGSLGLSDSSGYSTFLSVTPTIQSDSSMLLKVTAKVTEENHVFVSTPFVREMVCENGASTVIKLTRMHGTTPLEESGNNDVYVKLTPYIISNNQNNSLHWNTNMASENKVSIELHDENLAAAILKVACLAGKSISINGAINGTVNESIKNESIDNVLDLLSDKYGISWVGADDLIIVAPKGQLTITKHFSLQNVDVKMLKKDLVQIFENDAKFNYMSQVTINIKENSMLINTDTTNMKKFEHFIKARTI